MAKAGLGREVPPPLTGLTLPRHSRDQQSFTRQWKPEKANLNQAWKLIGRTIGFLIYD